jgi:hypothetical protein
MGSRGLVEFIASYHQFETRLGHRHSTLDIRDGRFDLTDTLG